MSRLTTSSTQVMRWPMLIALEKLIPNIAGILQLSSFNPVQSCSQVVHDGMFSLSWNHPVTQVKYQTFGQFSFMQISIGAAYINTGRTLLLSVYQRIPLLQQEILSADFSGRIYLYSYRDCTTYFPVSSLSDESTPFHSCGRINIPKILKYRPQNLELCSCLYQHFRNGMKSFPWHSSLYELFMYGLESLIIHT